MPMKTNKSENEALTPAKIIDEYIASMPDWRGSLMAQLRTLIHNVAPELEEEWKWGTPVFAYKGNVVAIGAFKDHLKLNFFKGASLDDPHSLFNAGFDAKSTRAIDIHEGNTINEAGLQELIRAALALNTADSKKK